jgi:hypothetical protein
MRLAALLAGYMLLSTTGLLLLHRALVVFVGIVLVAR